MVVGPKKGHKPSSSHWIWRVLPSAPGSAEQPWTPPSGTDEWADDATPHVVQALVEGCRFIEVKRFFAGASETAGHRWVGRLDLREAEFGMGNGSRTRAGGSTVQIDHRASSRGAASCLMHATSRKPPASPMSCAPASSPRLRTQRRNGKAGRGMTSPHRRVFGNPSLLLQRRHVLL